MNFNDLSLDALAEIFNQGVGQAANALSQLANEEVLLSVPILQVKSKKDLAQEMDKLGAKRICAVSQAFTGAVNTNALLMFPVDQSLQLVQLMVGGDVPLEHLGEMEQEALGEIGNILLNSLVASFADALHIEFEGSLPHVQEGETSSVLYPDGNQADKVLSLEIEFQIASKKIKGYLLFLLDVASQDMLEVKINEYLGTLQ